MSSPLAFTLTFLFLISTNLLLSEAASSNNQTYNNFLECLIDQFQRSNSSTNTIFTPQNATYTALTFTDNFRVPATWPGKPDLVVAPRSVSEIQGAVLCSRILGLQIKVKSGGHDYEGLSFFSTAGSEPFVVVNMINFRSVTIDEKANTARVQPAATLGELYQTISRTSKTLAFPAGACPTVGVGGHLLGGGYYPIFFYVYSVELVQWLYISSLD